MGQDRRCQFQGYYCGYHLLKLWSGSTGWSNGVAIANVAFTAVQVCNLQFSLAPPLLLHRPSSKHSHSFCGDVTGSSFPLASVDGRA